MPQSRKINFQKLRTGTHETFKSLEVRNFRLFFIGQLISQTGNWLTLIAQALLVLHLTDNNGVAVGVLTGCQFFPLLFLGAWTGVVADRSDKRKLLMIVQSCAMGQSFILAILGFSHDPPLYAFYAVALLGGVATAFDNPTRRSFIVEMIPDTHVQNAVSLNSALMTGSRIFGPAIAGLLITTVGYGWCFTVDGLSYVAVIYGLSRMRIADLYPSVRATRSKGQVREGLKYVFAIREIRTSLVMLAIVGTFAFNFDVVIPLLVKKTFSGSDGAFTLLYAVVSLGSLGGALMTARRTTNSVRQISRSALIFGISLLAIAAAPNFLLSFPGAILLGFASISFMTSIFVIVQLNASSEMRGRVLAIQALVFLGATPIGGPIVGALCQLFGARIGFFVGALACFVAAAYGHRNQPK
ncbi:MAG: MFS transporter [Actinobacteria bacterium]|nr:MFS transporter [Actinomycetota bacterium]